MKSKNIKFGVSILFVFICNLTMAQQQPQYTQHMYNTTALNPAYAGTNEGLEATLLHRSQWVGVTGAPVTQSLSIDGKVGQRISLGLGAYNEKIGPSNEVNINGIFAYEVMLGQNTRLSLGLNLGIDFYNVDWSKGLYYDNQDPIFNENVNEIRPIVGAGSFLYGEKWYLGVSAPNLLGLNSFNAKNDGEQVIERVNHYYLMGGYIFDVSRDLKFKPAVLAKVIEGSPVSIDASANFLIQDKITLGAAYRFNDAVSGIIGLQLGQRIFVGYSYDYTLTDLSDYNNGSHEIILKYSGGNAKRKSGAVRFF
ncbi:type IX secretion system membrane protein PorP/SprF [Aureibaculum algae]|uniref:Type IX secretion system membrane protein PorP/SprF n=1 Tax=Aureibaculum algae TaxID=2584122 RepID=A0A5B7TSS3_9FLAO|nr:type IX secretion system membrane protein PorP/SprF [Aureibaculum algae]QCX38254.1 type IX secretion system membrane protein PorP/SprF [Aureibaculum algae]